MDCNQSHPVNRTVLLAEGSTYREASAQELEAGSIGVKASGLLRIPSAWVPAFFVVMGDHSIDQATIDRAATACGITSKEVYVRSNGTLEGLEERGTLDSRACQLSEAAEVIVAMQRSETFLAEAARQRIHFIVQTRITLRDQGHLSNERRISRQPRDWQSESDDGIVEPVGVRTWRDASSLEKVHLACANRASVTRALRAVAAWAKRCRAHFEWIWDGSTVWVVQLDFLPAVSSGTDPLSLVSQAIRPKHREDDLSYFTPATTAHFARFSKLSNARIYTELGYQMPDFYVLCDPEVIHQILRGEDIPAGLAEDFSKLCAYPFVLRTQASGVDKEDRQMLPRSDELRSQQSAVAWLKGPFRDGLRDLNGATNIALIGHHFIPATASAWAQAHPDERRVRVESLWGIPEGSYYFAHDVYDVDTGVTNTETGSKEACIEISSRERYKAKYIAPNAVGEWIIHHTDDTSDWSRSIKRKDWLREIAWTTRLIAAKVGHPVVVMWFVDLPSGQSTHRVMPWYHEEWKPAEGGYKKASPATKNRHSEFREISDRRTWERFLEDVESGTSIERVIINPSDSEIIRDREFIQQLATHAKEHGYVVELNGGLLSHAFYMLNKAGCNVECVDLFAVQDEQLEFNKLVRDLVPQGIESRGEQVEVVKLTSDALIEALRRKMVEEVYEVADARGVDAILEELADVEETMDALLAALGIERPELAAIQKKKRDRRGAFSEGTMLLRTSLPAPISSSLEPGIEQPMRIITRVDELPVPEQDFHADHRRDASGLSERQLTMTLSTQTGGYSSGFHNFDLATNSGASHQMMFTANIERKGTTLKLRVRLSNAAVQLTLPFDRDDA